MGRWNYGMAAARRRHFGGVRKLPRCRYQARYWHAGNDHVAPSTFAAKTDALVWLSAAETDIHRGAWTAPKAGKTTLAEYPTTWLHGRSGLRPVTRSKYGHMLERHVLPVLGRYELATLSPSAVRSWYMAMRQYAVQACVPILTCTTTATTIPSVLLCPIPLWHDAGPSAFQRGQPGLSPR
jgi:Phage integrase, N-terminal SAM-like domain